MAPLLRILPLLLLVIGSEWLTACRKTADATPQPQAQTQTGAVVGQAAPAAALTSVTATPVGSTTAYTATLNAAGSYTFVSLPVGTYTIAYGAANGYVTPPARTVTVTVNNTSTLPALTLLVQTSAAMGQVLPAGALTGATATPTGGGTAYTAIVNPATGNYGFASLPVGSYSVAYTVAAGYPTPAPQPATVTAWATAQLPSLTLQLNPALLLTARNWRISAASAIYFGQIIDTYASLASCSRDNFLRFDANKTFVEDEGPTKCAVTAPQTTPGTWDLVNNNAQLLLMTPGSFVTYDIVQLTANTLQLRLSRPTYTETTTFTAF